jgi:hypothetical protein
VSRGCRVLNASRVSRLSRPSLASRVSAELLNARLASVSLERRRARRLRRRFTSRSPPPDTSMLPRLERSSVIVLTRCCVAARRPALRVGAFEAIVVEPNFSGVS